MPHRSIIDATLNQRSLELIREIGIPAMPAAVLEAWREMNAAEADFNRISRAVSRDPSLAAKVLLVANSSFYGRTMANVSIHQALVRLGIRGFHRHIIIAALRDAFRDEQEGSFATFRRIWSHLVLTARLAELVTLRLKEPVTPEHAYIAGLFHDGGIVILEKKFPGHLQAFAQQATDQAGQADMLAFDRKHLQTDHAQIGELMARSWLLPEEICLGIGHHHDLDFSRLENRNAVMLARILQLADRLASHVARLHNHEPLEFFQDDVGDSTAMAWATPLLEQHPWNRLHLSDLQEICAAVMAEFDPEKVDEI
ncbi:MAG: HDOD domain-containing protein [Magnetococcales bacterium]|nr:HDOD domain-containing protein [Magnetococcales bacterium]